MQKGLKKNIIDIQEPVYQACENFADWVVEARWEQQVRSMQEEEAVIVAAYRQHKVRHSHLL